MHVPPEKRLKEAFPTGSLYLLSPFQQSLRCNRVHLFFDSSFPLYPGLSRVSRAYSVFAHLRYVTNRASNPPSTLRIAGTVSDSTSPPKNSVFMKARETRDRPGQRGKKSKKNEHYTTTPEQFEGHSKHKHPAQRGKRGRCSMRPYEHKRAQEIRQELITLLGKKCAECGSKRKLEFNHVYNRTWTANHYNMYQRMLKIRKETQAGIINLLCRTCNAAYRPLQLPF